MGASTSRPLVAQPRTALPTLSPVIGDDEDQPLELFLGDVLPKSWEEALRLNAPIVAHFNQAWPNGARTVLTMTRNHWPRQVVREFTRMGLGSETKTPARVEFSDARGRTVAVLLQDVNDVGKGYYVGNGRAVVYATRHEHRKAAGLPNAESVTNRGDEENICRFCLAEEDDATQLVWPCDCKTPVHRACLARWQRRSTGRADAAPRCEICHAVWTETPPDVTQGADGNELQAIAEIRPVLTPAQARRRGFDPVFGGLGLYLACDDAATCFASQPVLVFDQMTSAVFNANRERVARCAATHGATAATRRVTVAAGVDVLLVLALASEIDANTWGGGEMRHMLLEGPWGGI